MITISGVSKIFYHGKQTMHALTDVNLHVPQGQICGVVGASGAGKSTLIRCVNMLDRPTSGYVLVGGKNLSHLSEKELILTRRTIGMIFQNFNLLSSRNVFDNISLPLEINGTPKIKVHQRVIELLELVDLSNKKNFYPDNLSGGQKQRVAIARALANYPKVLLCDEATSALDPAATRSILELLKNINQRLGLTILLITHEMDVVKRICDQVIIISEGHLIEQGSVSEVFSRPKTPIAQNFVQSTLVLDIPEDYQVRLKTSSAPGLSPLLKLEFTGKTVDVPFVSMVVKKFSIDINILSSKIDYAGDVKFGFMLIEIRGVKECIQQSIAFLEQYHIKVKVLGYV